MSEADTLFAALRQSTGDDIVALLERMVRDSPDHALNKINALNLAAKEGVGEERVIAALLNAVGLGIVVAVFRRRSSTSVDELSEMKG